ncbi:protein required for fusion of vesicles in vesicular transport [Moesziomyces antarcticus T-34]|uniref:ASTRA-associated protein 1 n=1 Tax=Pseudozyma antarctica (strain T-34) TaxID=1151754 RepID=M9MFW4_PSEA3|nr:protein required for fusion of vesicles in vesicular transport [Moesziomyces antarcticus T-34]
MKPYWILRHHGSSSIRSIHHDRHSLFVGDETGAVSIVDLHHLRPTVRWNAHTDSILTVISLGDHVLTHSRDNNVHLWKLPDSSPALGTLSQVDDAQKPQLVTSVGVNALNFSRCAYNDARIAVPNALDAAYIDVIELQSGVRLVEAIGRPDIKRTAGSRMPIVMSLHLVAGGVVAGYEDGWVKRWTLDGELVWQTRCHSESVMSTAISTKFGVSVGADDRIARFDLLTGEMQLLQTKTPGKASVAIAPDANTFVVGAWDGSIRAYSMADLTELGNLSYHSDTVECLEFASMPNPDDETDDDDDDDDSSDRHSSQHTPPARDNQLVLAAGGRDGKISLWKYF